MSDEPGKWVDYYHKGCGGLVFSHLGVLKAGDRLMANNFKDALGQRPDAREPFPFKQRYPSFKCDKCGEWVGVAPPFVTASVD